MAWAETVYGKPVDKAVDIDGEQASNLGVDEPHDDAPLPEIPEMYRAIPAVLEAQLILQGRSISRPITDGRVVR